MEEQSVRILFVGGGTAGPVTPLLAVHEELTRRMPSLSAHWVGTHRGPERRLVADAGIAFTEISAAKIDRFFSPRNLIAPFVFLAACWQARRVLKEVRPDVIVAAGAFVAVPVVMMARLMRIPSLIHQLDVRPGLANKMMAPFATAITVTFQKSLADFAADKTFWTGAPVRRDILQSRTNTIPVRQGRPCVLIFGGGTGAQAINDLVTKSIDELTNKVDVIHITGPGKGKPLARDGYHPFEFLGREMGEAYAKSQVVVSRAGLGTFLELAALKKPSIIIPIPDSHQEDNAAVLSSAEAAMVIDQRQLSPQEFAASVLWLAENQAMQAQLAGHIALFYQPNAARAIVDKILEIGYSQPSDVIPA